jgi:hypothetical protein
VVAETLNARLENAWRIRAVALLVAFTMAAAWICGGYWYVQFYPALVICVAGMILITGLTIEGAGAVIDRGVKIALLRGSTEGAQ